MIKATNGQTNAFTYFISVPFYSYFNKKSGQSYNINWNSTNKSKLNEEGKSYFLPLKFSVSPPKPIFLPFHHHSSFLILNFAGKYTKKLKPNHYH